MVNNCCVVCCINYVGKKKASVCSTVFLQLSTNLDLPHMATLEVFEGFQALPLHQLPFRVDPRALDVIAKDTPILYRWPLGHIVNEVAAITSLVWIILFFKTKEL